MVKTINILCALLFLLEIPLLAVGIRDHDVKKINSLLQKAEVVSAVSGQKALLYADSALILARMSDNSGYQMAALRIVVQTNLYIGDYDACIVAAEKLSELASDTDNELYQMYAHIGLGQANIMKDNYDLAKRSLDTAYTLASRLQNDSALCSVYNGLGLYHTNGDANYYRAIEYYLKGIKAAERSSYERLYSLLLCNLSGVYNIKRDASGLQYALECYQRGHELNQSYIIYIGAINTAYCYYLKGDYTRSLRYLSEAEQMMKEKEYLNQANVYSLLANIFYKQGNYNKAKQYFEKALHESKQTQTSYIAESYLGLGRVSMAENDYKLALFYLNKGLNISTNKNNAVHRRDLYYEISRCYESLGRSQEALDVYKKFVKENDSIFNKDKEYALAELMIKYRTEQKENLLKERDIELVKSEKHAQMLYGIVILAAGICILLYWLNRRKNKRYLQIVRQNLDFVEREKILEQAYMNQHDPDDISSELDSSHARAEKTNSDNDNEKYATSALTEEKSTELYHRLHRLMIKRELYKDNSLSKDKLAEALHTNRTYLSQVINTHTGLSFTHYINRLRVEEARRVLSDPNNDMPLKAIAANIGFNSLSTFYNAFQSIIGMPPSAYRAKMLEIFHMKKNI